MNILHISDIQPGHTGIENEQDVEEEFRTEVLDNYISDFNLIFEEINNKDKIDLVIISGDLSSKSSLEEYLITEEFLKSITKYSIPILIAPGNHDVNWEKTKLKKDNEKFINFLKFLNQILDSQGVKNLFKEDSFAYYINYPTEILFIAINTNLSIDHNSKETVFIPLDYLKRIKDKIISNIGKELFKNLYKVLISHHGWQHIEKSHKVGYYLNKWNFILILSGHIHKYDRIPCGDYRFENIFAGSLLTKNKKRIIERGTNQPHPPQFNCYKIIYKNNCFEIKIKRYYSSESEWKEEIKESFYYNKLIKNIEFKGLNEDLINYILQNYSLIEENYEIVLNNKKYYSDYTGFNKKGIRTHIFTLKKTYSDMKRTNINQIYRLIKKNLNESIIVFLLDKKRDNLLTIPMDFINNEFAEVKLRGDFNRIN